MKVVEAVLGLLMLDSDVTGLILGIEELTQQE